jgi:hypothetical protein
MSGPGQRSWAEEVMQAGVQMMTLPFRLFGLGLQVMAQAMEGAQRTAERNLAPPGGAAPGPGGSPAPWAGARSAVEPTDRAVIGAVVPAPPISAAAFNPSNFTGNAESGGGAVEKSETKAKEDKNMSCCDNDLSGCELKVVQYSIVSVAPYLKDFERMVTRLPRTVAISDDMTDADFTAYVIAKAMREEPERFRRYKTKYLRVCYSVICRLAMPCTDYEKDQVKALRDINRTLMSKEKISREDLARYEEEDALEDIREEERLERSEREGEGQG